MHTKFISNFETLLCHVTYATDVLGVRVQIILKKLVWFNHTILHQPVVYLE